MWAKNKLHYRLSKVVSTSAAICEQSQVDQLPRWRRWTRWMNHFIDLGGKGEHRLSNVCCIEVEAG